LHLDSAIDTGSGRVQISNKHGRVNGWTNRTEIFGICIAIDGHPRAGVDGKAIA
jgi:hypothetical protein